IVNADQHVKDALTKIGERVALKGTRGAIVDASGTVLAESTLLYDAQLSPKNVKPLKVVRGGESVEIPWAETAGEIAAITGQTAEEVMGIVADALAENPDSQFAYLKRGLTTEQYRALAELGLPYLSFTSQPSRVYPQGAVAGSLTGFVGVDGTPLE